MLVKGVCPAGSEAPNFYIMDKHQQSKESAKILNMQLTVNEAAVVMAYRANREEMAESLETVYRMAMYENVEPIEPSQRQASEDVFDLMNLFNSRPGKFLHLVEDLAEDLNHHQNQTAEAVKQFAIEEFLSEFNIMDLASAVDVLHCFVGKMKPLDMGTSGRYTFNNVISMDFTDIQFNSCMNVIESMRRFRNK